MESLPPPYSDAARYSFPEFTIGSSRFREPLVGVGEVKSHLTLLRFFLAYRSEIHAINKTPDDMVRSQGWWKWFVGLAVERFDRWCMSLVPEDTKRPLEDILPPVDVIMVWHSYMLSPIRYAEDCLRLPNLEILSQIGKLFSDSLSGNEIHHIMDSPPSKERVRLWVEKTSTPFNAKQSALVIKGKDIYCPKCGEYMQALFIKKQEAGYLQQNFKIKCPRESCALLITKDTLVLVKLIKDITAPNVLLLNATSSNELKEATMQIKKEMVYQSQKKHNLSIADDRLWHAIIEDVGSSLTELKKRMETALAGNKNSSKLVKKIVKDYLVEDRIFSVDLYGAVLRQESFMVKMEKLQWTRKGYFDFMTGNAPSLVHAISRYHAFLDLMSSAPTSFFVPTLDIDLVWHTHQLLGGKYASDCKKFVGKFVMHDDTVGADKLYMCFELTARAWRTRFQVQYSFCGCPMPGESVTKKIMSRLSSASESNPRREDLVPPAQSLDLLSATHASDDTSGFIFPGDVRRHWSGVQKARSERSGMSGGCGGGGCGGCGGCGG